MHVMKGRRKSTPSVEHTEVPAGYLSSFYGQKPERRSSSGKCPSEPDSTPTAKQMTPAKHPNSILLYIRCGDSELVYAADSRVDGGLAMLYDVYAFCNCVFKHIILACCTCGRLELPRALAWCTFPRELPRNLACAHLVDSNSSEP